MHERRRQTRARAPLLSVPMESWGGAAEPEGVARVCVSRNMSLAKSRVTANWLYLRNVCNEIV